MSIKNSINGVVVRTGRYISSITQNDSLEATEIETFIRKLPGYTEQNLTLNFMIYFLFGISAVIVAIFLYVLTVQKISMFGVMKAQGISNMYLSKFSHCTDIYFSGNWRCRRFWIGVNYRCIFTKCSTCLLRYSNDAPLWSGARLWSQSRAQYSPS